MALWIYLLHTHTILPGEDGAFYTGQCTYGDMNMHLGFITSLARQQAFPPDYSIMPGVRLSYPFLSDSVSSSLLVFGASLRLAYILPMLFAMAQIFTAVYLFAGAVLEPLHKNARPAVLLTIALFFLNGGFGFAYFVDWARERNYRFSDIFTGYYTTPTNLVDQNIRWVNLIADMFLPQRATLFGYAALFPALWLLYRAAFQERRELFPLAGLFAAALPMIHTHSFLSLCMVSAVWMLLWLCRKLASPAETSVPQWLPKHPGAWILAAFFVIMCLVQYLHGIGKISPNTLMAMGAALPATALVLGVILLIRYIRTSGWRELLPGWGLYLACLVALALPQLLFWTFGQVAQGGFVRGHFNWGNQGDLYPWFYLKNIGVPLFLILGGTSSCDRKRAPLFLPALFLWWIGELIVFTPNTYDNNKLLYAAYLLLCIGAADYGLTLFQRLHPMMPDFRLAPALLLCLAICSGILTLGREVISKYQIYGTAQVKLAEYAEQNTAPDAVYLTGTRHNNEIASLSGRNIVCGADTFLYFHGLDTSERKVDMQLMYEAPLAHPDLYQKYNVSYVVISDYERYDYAIDEGIFREHFQEVFSWGSIALYQVSSTAQ